MPDTQPASTQPTRPAPKENPRRCRCLTAAPIADRGAPGVVCALHPALWLPGDIKLDTSSNPLIPKPGKNQPTPGGYALAFHSLLLLAAPALRDRHH